MFPVTFVFQFRNEINFVVFHKGFPDTAFRKYLKHSTIISEIL